MCRRETVSKKKVVVGMSGGVDSSVAAYLLKEQGYQVVGVTMRVWQQDNIEQGISAETDARRVAETLGIDHRVVSYEEQFRREVVDYFVGEYLSGRTPNPCNMCNRRIKWESLIDVAKDIGAEYVATGHYARVDRLPNGRLAICNSATATKDQTYALCNLTQEQLEYTIMPIGSYEKDAIRQMAANIGLDVASKADSQDICFIPDGDYAAFIRKHTGVEPSVGHFVDRQGNILGTHKGITDYTIGQRKGLNLAMGHPVFVTGIDAKNNQVIIGESEELFTTRVVARNFNYMAVEKLQSGQMLMGKVRYAHKGDWCKVIEATEDTVVVEFQVPVRAITPGQALVLYDGEYVAGGGIIC
ncbi:MAG: tRNA 2-thiouridine(34) synthase MnmA [Lachnospiraceae bacterium]|nr:tRNA 2-thiouridine(34) synthase MnmA [Lachnospiraceae bacterium]